MAKRRDRRHVGPAQQALAAHEDRELAAPQVALVRHPAEVDDALHGAVLDLGRPLVVCRAERREALGRRRIGAPVPAEQPADLKPDRKQRPDGHVRALGGVPPGHHLDEAREVLGRALRRQLPDVLDRKAGAELVDPPRTRSVSARGQPHLRKLSGSVACRV